MHNGINALWFTANKSVKAFIWHVLVSFNLLELNACSSIRKRINFMVFTIGTTRVFFTAMLCVITCAEHTVYVSTPRVITKENRRCLFLLPSARKCKVRYDNPELCVAFTFRTQSVQITYVYSRGLCVRFICKLFYHCVSWIAWMCYWLFYPLCTTPQDMQNFKYIENIYSQSHYDSVNWHTRNHRLGISE